MERLNGRVAVVTGGAGGIGRAMGERFAAEGMKVVLADVQPDAARQGGQPNCRATAPTCIGVPTDVADFASVEALRDATLSTFGAVHVVCNNAGIGAGAEGRDVAARAERLGGGRSPST